MGFSLNNIFQFFVPKDKKFFPLFEQATTKLVSLTSSLNEAANASVEQREMYFQQIVELDAEIEKITHKTLLELSKNFLTPFDREDIHALITSIDGVTDFMHDSASRMRMYQVEKITKPIKKLTEINFEATQLIADCVSELKDHRFERVAVNCKKINKLETKADEIFDKAIEKLFENETDAKKIIQYKEVLSALESATDKCKSVSNILEAISVKYS
ncbi:MAG: DUF47 domain-containing protein [Bacteroidetes bacterium]|nr:DUF47 domain-containing protein [Bacteroidota bacterium]